MKECDNIKIHTGSNFILSINLLIVLDTLLLRPSLHCTTLCNTSPHLAQLPFSPLRYTYRRFTSSHSHFTTLSFGLPSHIYPSTNLVRRTSGQIVGRFRMKQSSCQMPGERWTDRNFFNSCHCRHLSLRRVFCEVRSKFHVL